MPRLRDQDRAVAAQQAVSGQVKAWKGRDDKRLREYRQELQQLPSWILTSGVGQTLAFYASKGKDGVHGVIGNQIAEFLTGGRIPTTVGLLDEIMKGDAGSYRRFTREALAYADWLKRYAAALIEKPEKVREVTP